jgi:hypothetical protein
MARAQSPIKVHESTKEKVRYAALMSGLQQAELVERAVDEYVERHREEFGRRIERAREALLGGKASTLAYDRRGRRGRRARGRCERGSACVAQAETRDLEPASSPEGQSARGSQSSASAASKASRKSTSRSRSSTNRPSAA